MGVSIFGAIFAAALASGLADHLPGGGAGVPAATDAAAIKALPAAVRRVYLDAFTAALQPGFLSAAIVAAAGFLLSWFLKGIPLRASSGADTIGESFAMPRDATSLAELEQIVARLSSREYRWDTYERISKRIDLSLPPDEMWLLIQLCRHSPPPGLAQLANDFSIARDALDAIVARLEQQALATRTAHDRLIPTDNGRKAFERAVAWQNFSSTGRRKITPR